MKLYFLIPLFLLVSFIFPIAAFNGEHPAIQHSSTSEGSVSNATLPSIENQDEFNLNNDPNEQGRIDHVEREADTFQTKFFNMLFILGLLIGFMILASWALKRMMKTKMTQLNTRSSIKVLETRYLSPRATLYLVEVQDQNLLIAESPTTVTYLTTLSPEAIDEENENL